MNNQGLTNLHGSIAFHNQRQLALFWGPSKAQEQWVEMYVDFIFSNIYSIFNNILISFV